MHTYKMSFVCNVHTCMHCGLMCGIWDGQSTKVEDLNDSQDPKHTLFCRKNAFVAIYAFFSDNKCPLFTRLGGGFTEMGQCHLFFTVFLLYGFPKVAFPPPFCLTISGRVRLDGSPGKVRLRLPYGANKAQICQ